MKRGKHLRLHTHDENAEEPGTRGAHGFDLLGGDFLDRLGKQFRDKSDRGHDQRHHAGQRAEPRSL